MSRHALAYNRLTDPACRAWAAAVAAHLRDSSASEWSREAAASHEAAHAVVAACYGFVPSWIRVQCRAGRWSGLVMPDARDPAKTGGDGIDAVIRVMVFSAAGYVGERTLWRDTMSGAYHEIAVVWYCCQLIEARYGVPAIVALRTTLRECELCLQENGEQTHELYRLLLRRVSVGRAALRDLLNVCRRSPEHWTTTALTHGRKYPEIEGYVARAAASASSVCSRRRAYDGSGGPRHALR